MGGCECGDEGVGVWVWVGMKVGMKECKCGYG